jgi:hypothetical protein
MLLLCLALASLACASQPPAAATSATPPPATSSPVLKPTAALSQPTLAATMPPPAPATPPPAPTAAGVPLTGTRTISLTINEFSLQVELATTPEQRQRGLMFRETLPEDSGMLFVFPADAPRSFWMKNTSIPLSIAFLDAEGRILNILAMQPFDEGSYPSAGPARYALEVNQGWFAERGISAGAVCRFTLPPDVPVQ